MKLFFAFYKPGVWPVLWGTVMLMTAGCALPIGPDYVTPLSSGQVPYIAEYNLQLYVPVPVAGQQPVKQVGSRMGMDVRVMWKDDTGEDITESLGVFENGLVYQAEITLTAKNGYEFAADIPFAYEEGMVREQTSDDNGHPTNRTVHAEYMAVTDFSPTPSSQKVDQTDLTSHIPAPAAGKAPVSFLLDPQYAGRVQWKVDGTPAEGPFKPRQAYEAVVTLIAVSGYTFTGLPANAFSHTGALSVSSEAGSGAVTISFAATGTFAVENYNLQDYVPVPAAGERAVKHIDRDDLTIDVVWKDEGGTDITDDLDRFALGVMYQAVITLTAKDGYAFKTDQPFAYPAGVSSLIGDNSHAGLRTLTVTYNRTKVPAAVTETNLTPYIPVPVTDATPVSYFAVSGNQYTGSVVWKKTEDDSGHTGPFAAGTAYSAVVSLYPALGYTLDGLTANSFIHNGADTAAGSVSYDSDDEKVTINFAPLPFVIRNFGSNAATPDSARKLIEARKGDAAITVTAPLEIDLPAGAETVPSGFTFTRADTSPAAVVINGGGRILRLGSNGSIMSVGNGVTLTLRDITLVGRAANNAPLVTVASGGTLKLESGAVIRDNTNASSAGGGVAMSGGTFTMNGGTITGNTAKTDGGGVAVRGGSFTMNSGTITGNTAKTNGGGVCITGTSGTITGGIISDNTAHNGGGVYASDGGIFRIENGSIRYNSAYMDSGIFLTGAATRLKLALNITAPSKAIPVRLESGAQIQAIYTLRINPAADIEGSFSDGQQLLVKDAVLVNNYNKFRVNGDPGKIDKNGNYAPKGVDVTGNPNP